MNSNHLWIVAAILASPGLAYATRNPTPPPSGIVVHLFGPNSVMSNVAPGLPGETPHPALAREHATPLTPASSVDTSNDPSWHAILHQMFVTGDPNDPNKPAPGRPSERQNVK